MLLLTDLLSPVVMDMIEGPETPSKRRLIAAGEKLFGERGLNGVSLQDIALAAGNANKYAVQYHFGNKAGLIKAILTLRLRWIDRRRQGLLEEARRRNLLSNPSALIETLYLPVAEQVDENGRHSFARFRLQYYLRIDHNRLVDADIDPDRAPAEAALGFLLNALTLDPVEVEERLRLQRFVLLAGLIDRDNRMGNGQDPSCIEALVARAVAITAAALT